MMVSYYKTKNDRGFEISDNTAIQTKEMIA